MSLAKTLLLSGVAVVGTVAGLVYLGRTAQGDAPHKAEKVNETLSAVAAASAAQVETTARPPLPMGAAIQHAARALVPEEAWLVVDFRGDLTGARPFEDQAGSCKDVPAPLRVVVALLAPLSKTAAGPELLLAAPQVTDEFWGCARDRVVSAGGTVLAQNAQYEVIKSPSGVVALGPHRSMIFLSNEGYLERGLTVMSDLGESAANTSAHAGLFRQLHPTGSVEMPTDLDLTLQLPADWLNSVGQDAQATPLRHLQAAYLSIAAQGGARGGISCAEPGCAEMLQFLQASKRDLLEALPQERARLIDQGLELIYQPSAGAGAGSRGAAATPTTGNITVRWSNASTKLQDVLGGLLPSGNLWGAPRP